MHLVRHALCVNIVALILLTWHWHTLDNKPVYSSAQSAAHNALRLMCKRAAAMPWQGHYSNQAHETGCSNQRTLGHYSPEYATILRLTGWFPCRWGRGVAINHLSQIKVC